MVVMGRGDGCHGEGGWLSWGGGMVVMGRGDGCHGEGGWLSWVGKGGGCHGRGVVVMGGGWLSLIEGVMVVMVVSFWSQIRQFYDVSLISKHYEW